MGEVFDHVQTGVLFAIVRVVALAVEPGGSVGSLDIIAATIACICAGFLQVRIMR